MLASILFMIIWIGNFLLILTIYKLWGSDLKCGHSDHFSVICLGGFYDHVQIRSYSIAYHWTDIDEYYRVT